MSNTEQICVFRPPCDWEAVFAADPEGFRFGVEPSQIARSALSFFQAFGGDPLESAALDLGSGEGRDTAFLAAAGFQVVAREIAPTGIRKTKALLASRNIPVGRVDVALGDARGYAYPEAHYDLALAANVYQFLNPKEVPAQIANLQRTVKPGGICAVGVFSPEMLAWGAELDGCFTATSAELSTYFPASAGWRLLDKTDYATYRVAEKAMASFAYVVVRKGGEER